MIDLKAVQTGIEEALRLVKDCEKDGAGDIVAMEVAGRAGAAALARVEKDVAPVYRGPLQGSIGIITETVSADRYHAEVGTRGIYYALLQNDGGTITPTNAKALRVVAQDGNSVKYVKEVHMPAQHYMEKALDIGREEAIAAVKAALGV